jgi:FkbM family methyltransferase
MEPNDSSLQWFEFLELHEPIRCLDVGAMAIGEGEVPWVALARNGCAEVIGFEPIEAACATLNEQATAGKGSIRYLPFALGDGEEHVLHVTNVPMTSSLFPPARETVDLFPALGELMQVVERVHMRTRRLDDLPEVAPVDFLKLDVQGAELLVLDHGRETLRNVSILQCEVEFLELYEGQPLFADVDAFLRSQGFAFLHFSYSMGRPFKPLSVAQDPLRAMSQILWADAIYVKDFRQRSQWSERQLRAGAFVLHEIYQAYDYTSLLLAELDRRSGGRLQEFYLASLLFSEPSLVVASVSES